MRANLGLRGEFVLYVGSIEPRKNTLKLIDALGLLRKRRKDVSLVLAGRRLFPDYDPVAYASGLGLTDNVEYLGYVDDEDLPGLYGAAQALRLPVLV